MSFAVERLHGSLRIATDTATSFEMSVAVKVVGTTADVDAQAIARLRDKEYTAGGMPPNGDLVTNHSAER